MKYSIRKSPIPVIASHLALAVLALPTLAQTGGGESGGRAVANQPVLEEIVVTAQKRATTLQRTPAAVAVVTSEQIVAQGVTDLQSLAFELPGLVATSAGAEFQMVVRGIGPASSAAGIDVPVGFNIDGVDTSRYMTNVGLIDVERIEVLPGPQGTLYGGASAGGVINIATRNPGTEFGIDGFLELGNYDANHLRVGVDLPVLERFQVRAVYDRDYHDGYLSNDLQDLEQDTARLTFAFQPTDRFSGNIKVTYQELGGEAVAIPTAVPIDSGDPWKVSDDPNLDYFDSAIGLAPLSVEQLNQYSLAVLGREVTFPDEFYKYDSHYSSDQEILIVNGRLDWEFDDLTLTYLAGYQDLDRRIVSPISSDGLNNIFTGEPLTAIHLRFKQFNERQVHELRLSNVSGSDLEWLVGAYYSHDEIDIGNFYGVAYASVTLEPAETDSYAAYGQATYSLRDNLRVTAGLRYNYDEKEMVSIGGFGLAPTAGLVAGVCPQFPAEALQACISDNGFDQLPDYFLPDSLVIDSAEDWDSVDYKLGLEYDLSDSNLLYATVQSGYLRGGINYTGDVLDPVELTSFVLGAKNTLADGMANLNVEGFYYDYQDLQVVFTNASGTTQGYNVPKSRVYGLEAVSNVLLGPDTALNGGITLLSAEYRDFDLTSEGIPVDLSGLSLQAAPKVTAYLGFEQTFQFTEFKLLASANWYYESSSWRTFDHGYISITDEGMKKDDFWISNASLTFMPQHERWSVGAYIRNIGDEDAGAAVLSGPVNVVERNVPRTYGIRLSFDY